MSNNQNLSFAAIWHRAYYKNIEAFFCIAGLAAFRCRPAANEVFQRLENTLASGFIPTCSIKRFIETIASEILSQERDKIYENENLRTLRIQADLLNEKDRLALISSQR